MFAPSVPHTHTYALPPHTHIHPHTQAAAKAAAAASLAAPVQLKGTLARMDPAQLIQHLDISIDVQPLQDFSIAPPVGAPLHTCAHHAGCLAA